MRVTTSWLIRAAALCAVLSGVIYIGIQFIHPEEDLAAVTTDAWVVVGLLTVAMAALGLAGVTGIYLRQTEQAGLLGLIGYAVLAVFFLLTVAFSFAESLILPLVVEAAPDFVQNFNGIFNGQGTDGSLGTLGSVGTVAGVLYLAGGVLFGIALIRARVLWTWAAMLWVAGAAIAPLTTLVPHEIARYAALPVALAWVGLGLSLWSESEASAEPVGMSSAPTTQPAV